MRTIWAVLEATLVVHVIRPFVGGAAAEIVAAPKVYGFDTGFVCYHRGWHDLRREDMGLLWEHLVLNEMHAHLGAGGIHYWRSKHGNEIDFVLARRGAPPTAIEGKWTAGDFDAANLRAFRGAYPGGANYVVASDWTGLSRDDMASSPCASSRPGSSSAISAFCPGDGDDNLDERMEPWPIGSTTSI